jgi:hypothetical protein
MPTPEEIARWGTLTYQERLAVLQMANPGGVPQGDLDAVLKDEIKRQYGYLAVYLDDPEIGPLLHRAAQEGWTQERLQADLYRTQFWQRTSAAQREWDLLWRTDPAEVNRRRENLRVQLRLMVDQAGIGDQFTDESLLWQAGAFLSQDMSPEQMRAGLMMQTQFQPGAAPVGQIGITMGQVKARAADYGLPMSDQAAFDWSKRVAIGAMTPDAVEVYLRDQAKSRYSWLAADLDRGATVRQLFDPMIQQTAQLLEIAPAAVDLTDPKFSSMVDHIDSTNTRRSMTNAEAATYIRSTPDWQTTDNATKAASLASESILRTFGKVAV